MISIVGTLTVVVWVGMMPTTPVFRHRGARVTMDTLPQTLPGRDPRA